MKIKRTLLLLFTMVFMLLGTSCNEKDLQKKKLVKTITTIYRDRKAETILFEYNSHGRLSRATNLSDVQGEGWTTKYTYSRNKIFANTIQYFEDCKIYTLNDLGYIESMISAIPDAKPYNFFYNNGYIKSIEYNKFDRIEFTWSSGNIVEINVKDDIEELYQKITCSYSNIINNPNCNFDFNYLIVPMWYFDGANHLARAGYFGKRSSHLISSCTWEWIENGDVSEDDYSFKFTFDSDGFVTSIAPNYSGGKYLIEYY